MCLIVFALGAHPRYRFVLAANRDEFYARPTAPAAIWKDAPEVLAGRDLAAGGTWLGLTTNGRFAAVTNYRDPSAPTGAKSRGSLTKNFLTGEATAREFLRQIEREKLNYSGFNLLVGDFGTSENGLFYFSNRGEKPKKLASGIYGLSNHLLDTAWHKVEQTKAGFTEILQNNDEISPAELLAILANRRHAPDEKLPETGVGLERERILSPAFIETSGYGTRSSTVLLIERDGRVQFTEKTFVGNIDELKYEFSLD